jgi:hypothetical protein
VNPSGLPQEIHLHVTEEQPEYAQSEIGNSRGTDQLKQERPSPTESQAMSSDYSVTLNRLMEQVEQERNYSKSLNEKLEAANHRNGYLEAQVSHRETQIKLLTDSQHKAADIQIQPGFWSRFGSWLVGKK